MFQYWLSILKIASPKKGRAAEILNNRHVLRVAKTTNAMRHIILLAS